MHACRFRDDNDGCALQPDVLSHGLVALAHCRAGGAVRGLAVLTAFSRWRPEHQLMAATYAPCMAAAAAAGDVTGVILCWSHMTSLRVIPDDACSIAFIGAAARTGDTGAAPIATLAVASYTVVPVHLNMRIWYALSSYVCKCMRMPAPPDYGNGPFPAYGLSDCK